MRISVQIDGHENVTWNDWTSLAAVADDNGIEGLFSSDHYGSFNDLEGASLDSWTVMAGLAQRTQRIRLGVLMSAATFRHPSVLARVTNTIDHISDGRVEVAIGAAWHADEHKRNGLPFPVPQERYTLLEEQVEVLVKSWAGTRFSFRGRHYQLGGQQVRPVPVQKPHPPLILGGTAKSRSANLAARFANEYNHPMVTPREFGNAKARLDGACIAIGRDPESLSHSVFLVAIVGATEKELMSRLSRAIELEPALHGREPKSVIAKPPVGWCVGKIEDVRRALGDYESVGAERAFLKLIDHEDLDALPIFSSLSSEVPRISGEDGAK